MTLVKTKIDTEKDLNCHSLESDLTDNKFISAADDYLNKHLKQVLINKSLHYSSNGKFGVHELIAWTLRQTGTANLLVSSFSISTDAVRLMILLKKKSLINQAVFIFDTKTKSNNAKSIKILIEHFPVHFINIHAKIFLIYNENIKIAHTGSGNLTNNPRIETGIFFPQKEIFDFYFKLLNDATNH